MMEGIDKMKQIVMNDISYELIKNYKDAYNKEELEEKFTEYFYDFDYIVGDYAYDKLRIKGFNKKENPGFRECNDYEKVDEYINNFCSYECRYYILEKKI